MTSPSVFSPRLLAGWIAAAVLTFAVSIYVMVRGGGQTSGSDAVGPSTFSRSAIGYAGIVDVLQRLGVTALKSQYNSLEKMRTGSVLVIAEPRVAMQSEDDVRTLLTARTVLLILPKWKGAPSEERAGWISDVDLKPVAEAQWTLGRAVSRGEVVRAPSIQNWSRNALSGTPSIILPAQLVRSDRLRPIVASSEGMLLGELSEQNRRVWVLADPDVMANHGLGRDGNAAFSLALINALRGRDSSVVFDETLHGYIARPASPFKLLFEFPFVLATVQGVIAVLLLLWATITRFGAPQSAPPPLSPGRQGLIQNAARLLAFGGHYEVMLRRYVHATIRDVARQIHAPRGLSNGALIEWLQRIGDARGVDVDCGTVLRRVDELGKAGRADLAPLVPIARDIHRWKREILDGPSGHSGDHRRGARRSSQGGRRTG